MDERSSEKKNKRQKNSNKILIKVNNYKPCLPDLATLDLKKKHEKVSSSLHGRCLKGKDKGTGEQRENEESVSERTP